MMYVQEEGEGFAKVWRELISATDRVTAIVGCSLIEGQLDRALHAHLHAGKAREALLKQGGPAGSLSAKIDLGAVVGIYGAQARTEFHIVRKIRNTFAHELEIRSFADEPVRGLVSGLRLVERYVGSADDFGTDRAPRVTDPSSLAKKDWPWWTAIQNRDEALKNPRQRFIHTLNTLASGLTTARERRMPEPYF